MIKPEISFAAGLLLIVAGLWWLCPPLALIVAGALLVAGAVLAKREAKTQ